MQDWNLEYIVSKLAGVAGALVSVRFLSGSLASRLVMALGGATFSLYAAEYVSAKLSLPEGLAGFLLGLFGMSILSRIWEAIEKGKLDKFIPWVRNADLPTKPPKDTK